MLPRALTSGVVLMEVAGRVALAQTHPIVLPMDHNDDISGKVGLLNVGKEDQVYKAGLWIAENEETC